MNAKEALSFSASILLSLALPLMVAAAPGDLKPGWPVMTDGIIFGAPAIGPKGEVVIGSQDRGVYSFNPDGTSRWTFVGAGDWIDSSPTIGPDGTVYVGCWDNFLYAIDGDSGSLKWKFETGSLITASAAIGPDGTIYIGSFDGYMYALTPDGQQKWSFSTGSGISPIGGGAVLNHAGDTLYFGTDDGELFAVNTAAGSLRWSYRISDLLTEREIPSAPSVGVDGTIYFGCQNNRVYAIDPSGTLKWNFPTTGAIRSSPIAKSDGTVYFASQDGYLYAVDDLGFQLWETFVGDVFYCSPALDAMGNIIIGAYAGNSVTGAATIFTSVDSTGVQQWEYLIQGLNDSSPNIAPDGSIYIGAHDGFLYKLEGVAPLETSGWPRGQASRRQTGWFADLTELELLDYFPSISVSKDGWAFVPWFGAGWLRDSQLPWIQHLDHGFVFVSGASAGSIYFYDSVMGHWLFAPAAAPNYYYCFQQASWLYHWQGTTVSTGRWFFDFGQDKWVTEAELK
ncbi:MAG: PQQ-binding-like beta-propeller repeat protein [Puniceicoccaceae bacterium]